MDKKISQLDPASTISHDDIFPIVRNGDIYRNYRPSLSQVMPIINVQWYGAVGDGVTNDRASIDTAIQAALSQEVPLYFPAGTYLITFDAVNTTLSITADLMIQGDGKDLTTIIVGPEIPAFVYRLFTVSGDVNVDVRNLTFQGPADTGAQVTSAFYLLAGSAGESGSLKLLDCDITRNFYTPIIGIAGGPGPFTGSFDMECYRCDLTGYAQVISIFGDDDAEKTIRLVDCDIHDAGLNDGLTHLVYLHPHIASYCARTHFYNAIGGWAWHVWSAAATQNTIPKFLNFTDCVFSQNAPIITSNMARSLFTDCRFLSPKGLNLRYAATFTGCEFIPTGDAGGVVVTLMGTYIGFVAHSTIIVNGCHVDLSEIINETSVQVVSGVHADCKFIVNGCTFYTDQDINASLALSISSGYLSVSDSEFVGPVVGSGIIISGSIGTIKVHNVRAIGNAISDRAFVRCDGDGANLVECAVTDSDFSGLDSGRAIYADNVGINGKIRHQGCKFRASATIGIPDANAVGAYITGALRSGVGANLASANNLSIDPSFDTIHITGVIQIDNIRVQGNDRVTRGFHGTILYLIADGAWNLGNGGNINPLGVAAVTVDDVIALTYDAVNNKWHENGRA